MKSTMRVGLFVITVVGLIAAGVYGSDGSPEGENQIQNILIRLEAAEERIQKLETKLEQKCKCEETSLEKNSDDYDSESSILSYLERRQVSSNALSGALSTLFDHIKYQRVSDKESPMKNLVNESRSESNRIGSVYTRWGRTSCDSDSALIYSGFAAGSYYKETGGGSNIQCMPTDPEYNAFSSQGSYAKLHGVEYESKNNGIFPKGTQDQNVPCARCYTPNSAVMMIPGKLSCPQSWMVEYHGYLMTQHSIQTKSTFECVDSEPERTAGESRNTEGALLYFIKADCGTLGHCPPYNTEKQITCVVCSK